jgi:hypothetical protein
MQRPTTAQLILRGRHGQTRVRVSWPQATLATPRPAVSVLFSEQWLVQDRVSSEHIKPTADELVLMPFWRASLGYEHGLDDALRVVAWTGAHAGDLDADPTRLRIGSAARLAFFIHDVIARMGAATAPDLVRVTDAAIPADGVIRAVYTTTKPPNPALIGRTKGAPRCRAPSQLQPRAHQKGVS